MEVAIPELESRLAGFPPADASFTRIDLLNQLAWELALLDPPRSRRLCIEALRLARRSDYQRGVAGALRTQAYDCLVKTRLRRALTLAHGARNIFSELGDRYGYATATDVASNCYNYIGNYDRALELAVDYNEVSREIHFRRGEAWSLYNMGMIYMAIDDDAQARERLESALEIFELIDHPAGRSRVLFVLGGLFEKIGETRKALEYLESSKRTSEEIGLALGIASALMELGRIHQAAGRIPEALECHRRCLEFTAEAPNKNIEAETRLSLGRLAFDTGDLHGASVELHQALRILENSEALPITWRAHKLLGEISAAEGHFEKAYLHTREYQRIKETVHSNESQFKLNNLQIRLRVESAEKEAELDRLRYEEKAEAEARLSQTLAVLSEDLELARRVQRSLLPDPMKKAGEVEIAVHFEPMIQVGGDIYDIHEYAPGRLRLFLADATGHGVQAALNTMLIKNEYERLRDSDAPLNRILSELNLAYIRRFASLNAFFTCTLIDLDTRDYELRIACGGHPEQYLYSAGKITELQARGAVIGAFEGAVYSEATAKLRSGDRLLMFSDGLEEIRANRETAGGEFYGVERLRASIQQHGDRAPSAADLVEAIVADAHRFRGDAPVTDDLTLIAAIVP